MISPGLLTTVQDLGRFGYAHLGISASGAADALALRTGNLLVGNTETAAAIEMTLAGGAFEFERDAVAAITGGDFDASIPLWRAVPVSAGEVLRCGHARSGARAYLSVRGGLDVPVVLGSCSTHLLTGLGGFEGRVLRKGDVLRIGDAAVRRPRTGPCAPRPASIGELRATSGPQASHFDDTFYRGDYQVSTESDRMGLRLSGPTLTASGGHMLTEGVAIGAVQVPPDGQPLILFVEHQTTGGYPKIANVISADLWRVGQLRPHDRIRFARVTLDEAYARLREQEAWLHGLV